MITLEVLGVDEVRERFIGAGERIRAELRETVQTLGIQLQGKVKADYLSGGALGVVTGRLRRSVTERTEASGDSVTSTVGTNLSYGRFWELGFQGVEEVREHVRRTHGSVATVRAHERHVNQAPRPFLHPALDDMRAQISAELLAAAARAT